MKTCPRKPNHLLLIAGVVVGCLTASLAVSCKPPSTDDALAKTAVEMNKRAPIMVDKETRLDSATTAPNKTLVYHYTLLNLRAADVPEDAFVKQLRPNVLASYKTNPDMKTLRDNGVTLEYQYVDKEGKAVAKFAVSPKDF